MARPVDCTLGWMDCWGFSQPFNGYNPTWGGQWGGYSGNGNNMPSLGNNNPNIHQSQDNIPLTPMPVLDIPLFPVTTDFMTNLKTFVNENPAIVIGGIGLVIVLLLKK